MGDIENVQPKKMVVNLGGKDRTIRYGMKAWGEIQKKYKGLEGIGKAMGDDQPKTIVDLVDIGLVREEGEVIKTDDLITWLDENYDIGGAVQLVTDIMEMITASLPKPKAGASGVAPQ